MAGKGVWQGKGGGSVSGKRQVGGKKGRAGV